MSRSTASAFLDAAPHEALGVAVHEVHVAAPEAARQENAVCVLHQIDEARARTLDDRVVRVRGRPDPRPPAEVVRQVWPPDDADLGEDE